MLYVFHVDTGIMLTFDMNLAMETVSRLQEVIADSCKISEDKQVLLISGGQSLSPTLRVCSYSAGTDTNPIFLFSKNTIESATPPTASIHYGTETDLNEHVEDSMNMPPSYETIVTRAQLALKFHEVGKEQLSVCQKLVHDQHLQHQGWAAVIANLEDITSAFRSKWLSMVEKVDQHLNQRKHRIEVLSRFPETVQLLSKIPLLQCLLPSFALSMSATMAASTPSPSNPTEPPAVVPSPPQPPTKTPNTLLEWITAQESKSTLDQMAKQCLEGLNQFDDKVRDSLKEEVEGLLEAVNNQSMKEVKGLEDRLSGLEQLMYGAHKVVQEQSDMAQGFIQNQTRARNLHDPSILPDLCNSHKRQLIVMLKNHQNLLDIRRRCMRAKDELSENLHTRLRWVMYIEKSICDVHGKLVIYHQRLKKLQHCLRLILQMHNAPDVYCSALLEVVRRKRFTSSFMEWSCDLCDESKKLHEKEIEKRHFFSSFFRNHFLQALFPGFTDKPPAFATKAPDKFDENLPPIDKDDIMYLKNKVPELAEKLTVPDDISASLVFPHISLYEISARSSKDSFSQTTISLEQVENLEMERSSETAQTLAAGPGQPQQGVTCGDQEAAVTDEHAATEQVPQIGVQNVDPLQSGILDQSGITVSQSVEVVTEAEVSCLVQEESLMALKVGPQLGHSPTAEVASVPKGSSRDRGPSDVLLISKVDRRDPRVTPSNSPVSDEGASEGFTTADFYIDESMPSSLTESVGRKLAELQQVVQDKTSQLEHKDRELEDHKRCQDQMKVSLDKAQDNFRLLHDVIQKGALQLRCDVLSVEKHVSKEKDEFQAFMDSVTKKLVDVIGSFEEEQIAKRDSEMKRLQKGYAEKETVLMDKLEVECEKWTDAQSEIDVYDRKLKEKIDECDVLRQTAEKSLLDIRVKHEEELTTAKNQMILEQEVELEKVKNDLDLMLQAKDKELQELSSSLDLKTKQLTSQRADLEKQEEVMAERFLKEKEQIRQIIVAEFEEKEQDTRLTIKQEIKKSFEKEKKQLTEECELRMKTLREQLETKLTLDKEKSLSDLRTELTKTHEAHSERMRTEFSEQKQTELDHLRDTMETEHKQTIDVLKSNHAAEKQSIERAFTEKLQQLGKEHEQEVQRLTNDHIVDTDTRDTSPLLHLSEEDYVTISSHKEELQKVIEEQQQQKDLEISELVTKFEKDKHDSLQDMITSTTADKQVIFNEALNKVVADHQKEIDDLKEIEKHLREELETARNEVKQGLSYDKSSQYPSLGSSEAIAPSALSDQEQELGQAKLKITQLESQLAACGPPGAMGVSVMGQSVTPVTDGVTDPRLQTLDATIKSKTEEVNRLSHKIMELSMSTSFRGLVQDKVSITSCNQGDLVLLCLDDQRANYVVFTVTNLLHFLHSDYLDILGLKTGAGEAKKSWVLAEVTDKEYCQAKKPQNRYNVPVGTKFYRIKAKPWSRESALQFQQQLRQQQTSIMSGIHPPGMPQPQQPSHQPSHQPSQHQTHHASEPLMLSQLQQPSSSVQPHCDLQPTISEQDHS